MPQIYKVLNGPSDIAPPQAEAGSGSIPALGSVCRVEPRFHELRTWVSYFKAVHSGHKTFEVRKNDRDFHVGDYLVLREWDHLGEVYTGRWCMRRVQHMIHGKLFGIEEGYVVMSLSQQMH